MSHTGRWSITVSISGPHMVEILYEDADILAVNKPEGLAAIPEHQTQAASDSLFGLLCTERAERLYIVHRIDKDTSGLIVFARHAEAHRLLSMQFEHRTVQKTYLALVHGVVADEQGAIDKPLGRFGSGRVGVNPQRGRASLTEYLVLRRFPAHTLVEAYPKTGRRHQIRVHLYSIGHPIVGDRLYGDQALQRDYSRMMLHAHRLTLHLPNGQPLTLEAPLPESFERVLETVERSS
jgi:tRNA pseudouridine32 synthase/23S rRNA pseudouridine746 synthase